MQIVAYFVQFFLKKINKSNAYFIKFNSSVQPTAARWHRIFQYANTKCQDSFYQLLNKIVRPSLGPKHHEGGNNFELNKKSQKTRKLEASHN
jgi:hypothetical protein